MEFATLIFATNIGGYYIRQIESDLDKIFYQDRYRAATLTIYLRVRVPASVKPPYAIQWIPLTRHDPPDQKAHRV